MPYVIDTNQRALLQYQLHRPVLDLPMVEERKAVLTSGFG